MLLGSKEKKIKPYKRQRKKKEENFFDKHPNIMELIAPEIIQEKRDYIYMGLYIWKYI